MGNFTSCRPSGGPSGKVVLSDGTIYEFEHPISVAELMLEHPQHFVAQLIRSPSKPTPLPADHKLDPRGIYILLPMAHGKPAGLPAEEAHRILSVAQSALRSRSFPFLSTMCMVGVAAKEKELSLVRSRSDTSADKAGKVVGSAPEWSAPEFLSRQLSCKGWKPSLLPIEERCVEKKLPHWLF